MSPSTTYATVTYINYGCALIGLNRLDEAQAALLTAERYAVEAGDALNAARVHYNLAEVALLRDDSAAALEYAHRDHDLAVQIGDPLRRAIALDMLASATLASDRAAAISLWLKALGTYREVGHRLAVPLERWLAELDASRLRSYAPATVYAVSKPGAWCSARPFC